LIIWLILREKGFEGLKNGEPHTFSKTDSALMVLIPAFIFPLWI